MSTADWQDRIQVSDEVTQHRARHQGHQGGVVPGHLDNLVI